MESEITETDLQNLTLSAFLTLTSSLLTPLPLLRTRLMPLPDLLDVTSLSPAPAPAVLNDPVVCAVPGQQYCMVDCTVPNNTIVVQEN